jgi:hypothetical protein
MFDKTEVMQNREKGKMKVIQTAVTFLGHCDRPFAKV